MFATAAPLADLALDVDVDWTTPAQLAHDHIQALEEVPGDEPGNTLVPQADSVLVTERLRKKLPETEVQRFHGSWT